MPPADAPNPADKFRAAVGVLNRAREAMLETMADAVLEMADEFAEGGFQVNEFLEVNAARLHLLCLTISQFELMADLRASAAAEGKRPRKKPPKARDEPPTGDESASPGEEAGSSDA